MARTALSSMITQLQRSPTARSLATGQLAAIASPACSYGLEFRAAVESPTAASRLAAQRNNSSRSFKSPSARRSRQIWSCAVDVNDLLMPTTVYAFLIAKGELCKARKIFTDLQEVQLFPNLDGESAPHVSSSLHQLGVIALKSKKLTAARNLFRKALKSWKEVIGDRPGFTLRRLGQVAEEMGDYDEALNRYIDAHEIFARYHCARCLTSTRGSTKRVARLLQRNRR